MTQGEACTRVEQSASCRSPRHHRPSLECCCATTMQKQPWKLTERRRCDGADLLRRWSCRPILHPASSGVLEETQRGSFSTALQEEVTITTGQTDASQQGAVEAAEGLRVTGNADPVCFALLCSVSHTLMSC